MSECTNCGQYCGHDHNRKQAAKNGTTRTYEVTLQVTIDRAIYDPPYKWMWPVLLDMPEENVVFVQERRIVNE